MTPVQVKLYSYIIAYQKITYYEVHLPRGSNRLVSLVVRFLIYVQSVVKPTDLIFAYPQSGQERRGVERSKEERIKAERIEVELRGEEPRGDERIQEGLRGAERCGEERIRSEPRGEERIGANPSQESSIFHKDYIYNRKNIFITI